MRRWTLCFTIVLLCLVSPAFAQGSTEFELNGVRFNNALLGFLPVPTGADLEFHVPLSGGLLFSLRAAGGYEDRLILRDDSNGSPIAKPASFNAGAQTAWFDWPNAEIDSGLIYRFTDFATAGIKAEVFGLGRGRWESNSPGLSTAYFPDAKGLLAFSFLGGIGADAVVKQPSRMSGWAGEASFEAAPSFLAVSGGTDFSRFSGFLKGYLPLYSSGADDLKAFSLYGAAYLTGDYAMGSKIPLYVLTGFGGRALRDGLGDSIRGYQGWGYEATTKAEASIDLRLVGPSLFKVASLRPIAYVFGDAGYFSGLYDCPSIADKDGLIFSTGGGLALDILDFAYLGLRAGYKFPVDDPLYATYFPGGERFFWGITFLLHF
jgi:hypothetical protein